MEEISLLSFFLEHFLKTCNSQCLLLFFFWNVYKFFSNHNNKQLKTVCGLGSRVIHIRTYIKANVCMYSCVHGLHPGDLCQCIQSYTFRHMNEHMWVYFFMRVCLWGCVYVYLIIILIAGTNVSFRKCLGKDLGEAYRKVPE